jgi:hypothetical protein
MGKAMSIAGMVVAGLIAFVFAFDLVLGFPFGGANKVIDGGFLVCGAILGYLSWNAFRDVR